MVVKPLYIIMLVVLTELWETVFEDWYHVAVVRSSGTTTLYLDGKSEGSFSVIYASQILE